MKGRNGRVDRTHNVPSIFVPCLCAELVHPEGGTVTRWCEKLQDRSSDAFGIKADALNKSVAEWPKIKRIA